MTPKLHAPSSVRFNGAAYSYGYDANGNTTLMHNFNDPANARQQTITYNADNMPRQIEWVTFSGGSSMFWTVDFDYDGQSRRVKKTKSWGSETFYIGDHFEIENGTEVKYIFAGNQRVAKVTAAGTHFFHKDHLGSSNVVTDYANGAAVETSEYMPFGQTRKHIGADISLYKFTDQELDPSTGLYNYDARLYDPVVGRFITADSMIPNWYDPQLLNRYSYVRNNPLGYIDPTGHLLKTPGLGEKVAETATEEVYRQGGRYIVHRYIPKILSSIARVESSAFIVIQIVLYEGNQEYIETSEGVFDKEDEVPKANNKVPNPHGRPGFPRHQAYVEDEVRTMQEKYANDPNIEVNTEVYVKGQDGKGNYIDAQAVNSETGEIVDQVQVGQTNKDGTPVIRERRNMENIDRNTGTDTRYRSYDR